MKRLFIILLCCILLFSSCSFKKEHTNPNFGGEINLFAYTPDTLNPLATAYKTNASTFSALLYKSLVTLNPDFSVSPCLAESWTFKDNGKTLFLKIRDDVYFSDGTKLDASHIKNSLEELKGHPDNLYYPVTDYIDSVSANRDSLTLSLKKAGSDVLKHLNFPVIKDSSSLIGCGSYILKSNNKNEAVLSAVSEASHPFAPNIAKVTVKYYPKPEMQTTGFLTSETDVISADMATLSKLTSKTNVTMTDYLTNTYTYLGFNNESTILTDENARKAIGYIIDKPRLLDTLFVGYALNTNSPFKPGTIYSNLYNGDFNKNAELAKEYLNKSDAENFNFSILVNEESATKKKVADYIAERLNENGMSVTVTSLPFDKYLTAISEGDYTAYIGEVNVSSDQNFSFLLKSDENNLRYKSSYMDSLLYNFETSIDENKKKVYAQEIQKQLLKHVPLISLYYHTNIFVANDKIRADYSPMQNNIYYGIEKWIAK